MFDLIDKSADWLHATLMIPALWHLGLMAYEEIAYNWVIFATYGVAQVLLALLVCRPLEMAFPLERWTDRKPVRVDIFYTVITRVGVLPLVTFVLFYQVQVEIHGTLADYGMVPLTLESVFPALIEWPVLTFVFYIVLLDFSDYWRHRLSHRFGWWYALHAVHHAQRRMTFWADDRNHVLDNVIAYVWFTVVALLVGIPPLQFPMLMLVLSLLASLSHINARIGFGPLRYVMVAPSFHRAHHGMLAAGQNSCNYGVLFPWWDMIFRTADFQRSAPVTGDPDAEERYATGSFIDQQIAGFRGLIRALRHAHSTTQSSA